MFTVTQATAAISYTTTLGAMMLTETRGVTTGPGMREMPTTTVMPMKIDLPAPAMIPATTTLQLEAGAAAGSEIDTMPFPPHLVPTFLPRTRTTDLTTT